MMAPDVAAKRFAVPLRSLQKPPHPADEFCRVSSSACDSLIIHNKAVYMCVCVLVFNSDYSSSLQIRLIGQRRRPVIDDGAPAAAAAAHAYDLIRCFVKSVGKIASAFVSPNTQMHAHNLQESLKTQTEESCCYVRCEFGDSLNRPPKQSQLDFRELNVLDFNKNK